MPRFADTLAVRLRRIRVECYGREGVEALSDEMGIHARTWENFEAGFTIPGVVLLRFIDLTGCDPRWLLTGTGSHYLGRARALEPSDAPRMRALGEDSS